MALHNHSSDRRSRLGAIFCTERSASNVEVALGEIVAGIELVEVALDVHLVRDRDGWQPELDRRSRRDERGRREPELRSQLGGRRRGPQPPPPVQARRAHAMGARIRRDRLAALPALQRRNEPRLRSIRSRFHQVVDFASREARVALRIEGRGRARSRRRSLGRTR